jgi:hypothetical protein
LNKPTAPGGEKEVPVVAKTLGIVEITLNDGVSPEEYERFVVEELKAAPQIPETSVRFFKPDRGAPTGTYIGIVEVPDVEIRNRLWPQHGEVSPELNRWFEEHGSAWMRLFSMIQVRSADYVEL